jgi:hypothetical protein
MLYMYQLNVNIVMSFIASDLSFRLLNYSDVYDKYMLNTNILTLIVNLLNMYIIVPDIVSIHFVYSY